MRTPSIIDRECSRHHAHLIVFAYSSLIRYLHFYRNLRTSRWHLCRERSPPSRRTADNPDVNATSTETAYVCLSRLADSWHSNHGIEDEDSWQPAYIDR